MTKLKLILATNNAHKVEEIKHFLADKFEIVTLDEMGFEGDIEENGSTLEENSLIKAQYIYEKYQQNCLADDSGLEVHALNNQPGVHSARYAGSQHSHADNMDLLLKNLEGQHYRTAQFKTVITLILDGKNYQFEGKISGKIISDKRGNQGFGYDPICIPEGHNVTFAEMSLEQKNGLSHRTRAIQKMVQFLEATSNISQ
jgi:XTP/dITP diphosphohydrolase